MEGELGTVRENTGAAPLQGGLNLPAAAHHREAPSSSEARIFFGEGRCSNDATVSLLFIYRLMV